MTLGTPRHFFQSIWMPREHTCLEVLLEPGPLYDPKLVEEVWAKALASKAQEFLCEACGFPCCSCTKCRSGEGNHSCWLGGWKKGKGKRSKVDKAMSEQDLADLQEAWAAKGFQAPARQANGMFQFS